MDQGLVTAGFTMWDISAGGATWCTSWEVTSVLL